MFKRKEIMEALMQNMIKMNKQVILKKEVEITKNQMRILWWESAIIETKKKITRGTQKQSGKLKTDL